LYNEGAPAVVAGCVFVGNEAGNMGGAVYSNCLSVGTGVMPSPRFERCVFEGNRATYGGAIACFWACPTIEACTFRDNTASDLGGALFNQENTATIINCVFTGNTAEGEDAAGGAICNMYYTSVSLTNCTLVDNHATGTNAHAGAIANCGEEAHTTLTNTILWANSPEPLYDDWFPESPRVPATYSCIEGGMNEDDGANHIIQMQPLLWLPANGDVRLRGGSPCIDTGTDTGAPPTDILGVTRPPGATDMGAYEYDGLPFVIISEVMVAVPGVGLRDENGSGDWSDWIEIFNGSTNDVNIEGWTLTDDPAEVAKWVVPDLTPDVVVPAGGYLVLFASGKDPSIFGEELHTNFTLVRNDGYLALHDANMPRNLQTELRWDCIPGDCSYAFVDTGAAKDTDDTAGHSFTWVQTPGGTTVRSTTPRLKYVATFHNRKYGDRIGSLGNVIPAIGVLTGTLITFEVVAPLGSPSVVWSGDVSGTDEKLILSCGAEGWINVTATPAGASSIRVNVLCVDIGTLGEEEWMGLHPSFYTMIITSRAQAWAWTDAETGVNLGDGGGGGFGRGNACTHAYMSALCALRIGLGNAADLMNAHEVSSTPQPPCPDTVKDVFNNQRGFQVAIELGVSPLVYGYEIRNEIVEMLNDGRLVQLTSPYEYDPLSLVVRTNEYNTSPPLTSEDLTGIPTPIEVEPNLWRSTSLPEENIAPAW